LAWSLLFLQLRTFPVSFGETLVLSTVIRQASSRTSIGAAAGRIKPLNALYRDRIWARRGAILDFWGKFSSYEEAAAAIPQRLKGGWNNEKVLAYDYFQPAVFASMFWIGKSLKPNSIVVDLGGSLGYTYYHYAQRNEIPPGVRWHVVDLPCTIERGRKLARERGAEHLTFGSDLNEVLGDASRFDVLLSSGCMQYMKETPEEIMAQLPAHPANVILNYMPMIAGPEFWTLESLMISASPYRIFNETELMKPFETRGYAQRDRWPVPELNCTVPFHPECYVRSYAGLCLTKT
jgi:putative methyltransferase (TIGR04325 family)